MMEIVLGLIDSPFHRRNKSFLRRHRSIFSDGDGGRLRDGAGRRAAPSRWAREAGELLVGQSTLGWEGSHDEES